ncbi:formate dehydrogenase gamma subunit [Marinobacterium halophilum]|uniref:NADH-quinone oxidoreductase subunit E n=1 Tax=Marinobacterium halophilum TaxID=267374 RepID=A0A2P8ERF7_9GAMM|nr:formate dehydrogenase subunit gamma [Marinobacterium halophilum]PSL12060.1 formate dehydrogenase gamma subunit [Marinobacterium halophilum]
MSNTDITPWHPEVAGAIIEELKSRPGALLPILHALQDRFGHIPAEAVALIAPALKTTRAEVHGVISFYHHFRNQQPGRHVVEMCRAEACQAQGARALEAHAKQTLGIDYHGTSEDRTVTLEPVYCLGNCACGPSVRVGDDIHAFVTPDAFDVLMDDLKTERLEVK